MSNLDHVFLGLALVGLILGIKILRECTGEWEALGAMRADLVARKARGEKEIYEESRRIEILASELADLKHELKDKRVKQLGVSNRITDVKKKLEKMGVRNKNY